MNKTPLIGPGQKMEFLFFGKSQHFKSCSHSKLESKAEISCRKKIKKHIWTIKALLQLFQIVSFP